MSNLSGLPPSAIARAAALALIQDVAVRLINLPESLSNNPQALTLSGTVKGQTPDGQVQVETDRGIINILLKDRGGLQAGQKIEIEIPAGRPPQQASIRPDPNAPAHPASANTQPNLLAAATAAGSSVKLDRTQTIRPDDIAEALLSAKPGEDPRMAAPLQAGQILRLIPFPISISAGTQPLGTVPNIEILKPEQLFNLLLQTIEQAAELPAEIKRNLAQILSRIDISTLLSKPGELSQLTAQETVEVAFQKLTQTLDLPLSLKLQNGPSLNSSTNLFLNPTRPLDVQILAFQNGNFQATLTNIQTPGTPILNAESFIVLPQTTSGTPIAPLPSQSITPGQVPTQQISQTLEGTPEQIPTPAIATQTGQSQTPPALLGQITGFTAQGQPIVSLAIPGSPQPVNFAVQFVANNIVAGVPIIVSPLPVSTETKLGFVPFAIGGNQSLPTWAQSEMWESFQTLIGNVTYINPALGQSMIQMLPSAAQPQNMGPLGLLFLSMMRTGELDNWIGQPAINLLRQSGKVDVLRQIAGENIMSNRLESTALPNDWRAAIFPFWHDQQIHKLPVYYKNWNDENESESEKDRKKRMRFMFELKLSRMGPVQVDGFMQREKLDMILRTKAQIGLNMQEALRKTYHKAMERSNLSGEITFQFKPEQWVNMEIAQISA